MNSSKCISFTIYFFALIGFLSLFQYSYLYRTILLPVFLIQTDPKLQTFLPKNQFPSVNPLLQQIDQCPECVLFTFMPQNASQRETIFNILNTLPSRSRAMFYPLTMKLFYNQAIPFYSILSASPRDTIAARRRDWLEVLSARAAMKPDSILDYIYQSLKKPLPPTNSSWPDQTKLILYYTKFFGNAYWYNSGQKGVYANDLNPQHCPIPVNTCRVTTDRKLFAHSDASLIHLRESINYDRLVQLPRRTNQRMVFFLKESPVHSPVLSSKLHGQIFNYTQTYRPDSDITATTLRDLFWLFDYVVHPDYNFQAILESKKPGKILVAVVSNCGGTSSRLPYIKELQQYISVDVFGNCGKRCPNVSDCRQYAYSKYKFYLAFENSLCDEYVTEKFFFALNSARVIPVVLGLARYDAYIPSSAYIDVRNFSSPQALASHISYLDRNNSAYLEYFRWRQYAVHIQLPKYICELCLKLFLDDRDGKEQRLEHIDQYWNREKQCHKYEKHQDGRWVVN